MEADHRTWSQKEINTSHGWDNGLSCHELPHESRVS